MDKLIDLDLLKSEPERLEAVQTVDASIRWEYPNAIFEALEHVDPAADSTKGDKSEDDPKLEELLGGALSALGQLEHLIFESSTLLNAKLMPLLPSNLRNLKITNCWEVTAEMLGEHLFDPWKTTSLPYALNHNSALSLAFLPLLGEACPYLEVSKNGPSIFRCASSELPGAKILETEVEPEEIEESPAKKQKVQPRRSSLPIRHSTRTKPKPNYVESPDNSDGDDENDDENDDESDD
ncbi:hypothetical protein DID88_006187 [Monilinia fructigena]|uniref:Uncharacterized protein n=1 Tax=Monilinia fructigena TaxID=38457 RepID=A0A395J1X3_9HELO|nr:hypothetical protein DID88_006187 [Monilinia fructigena]